MYNFVTDFIFIFIEHFILTIINYKIIKNYIVLAKPITGQQLNADVILFQF